jgi:hypothetical protein
MLERLGGNRNDDSLDDKIIGSDITGKTTIDDATGKTKKAYVDTGKRQLARPHGKTKKVYNPLIFSHVLVSFRDYIAMFISTSWYLVLL